MPLGEFDIIRRFFLPLSPAAGEQLLGIGDDCALLSLPAGEQLVTSVDTLVREVHFPADAPAHLLGWRALAVSASDLAACGAQPLGFTLALTLPALDEDWLADFSRGLAEAAEAFRLPLLGGDTTRGPLTLSVQVLGSAPPGSALLRRGAQVGDAVWVTGELGDARAALDRLDSADPATDFFLQRYYRPRPPLAFAQALRGLATAAVDLSDGLLADLGHILARSGVGAEVDSTALPLSAALREHYAPETGRDYALRGGDDYQLCFTAAAASERKLRELAERHGVTVTRIGKITAGRELLCRDADGQLLTTASTGYQHFAEH